MIGLRQDSPNVRDPWGSRCRDLRTGEWTLGTLCGPVPTDGIVPIPAAPATTFATSPDGVRRYEFVHRALPADQLITSHDPFTFQVNPAFAQAIQPRLRDRTATELQVKRIAANLSPEVLLTDYHTLDRGAPIIGPDRLVESGNGRVMGIMRAIKDHPQAYAAYREMLLERCPTFGLDAQAVARLVNPVLVSAIMSATSERVIRRIFMLKMVPQLTASNKTSARRPRARAGDPRSRRRLRASRSRPRGSG